MTYIDTLPEFRSGNSIPVTRATFTRERMQEVLDAHAFDLLEAARAAEAILTRQKFTPNGFDPEGIALGKLRAAIARATGSPALYG